MSKELSIFGQVTNVLQTSIDMGNMIYQSGMFGLKNAAQGCVLALECLTRGKSPAQIMAHYHIVEGRLDVRSDFALAELQKRGWEVTWIKYDSEMAKAEFVKNGKKITLDYDFETAKASKICFGKDGQLKNNWASSRPDMLRARLIKKTARMLEPGIFSDLYTTYELNEIQEEKVIQEPSKHLFENPIEKQNIPDPKPEILNAQEGEFNEVENKEPEISEELQKQLDLESYLDTFPNEANSFLRAQGWIAKNETFRALNPARRAFISKKIESFKEKCLESFKKGEN